MIFLTSLLPHEVAALPDGRRWRGPNALADLARTLIGEGADPTDALVALRDGQPVLEGTIGAFAAGTWAGADADPARRKWRPHPRAQMPPRLLAWAVENGFLRPGRYPPTRDPIEAAGDAARSEPGRDG